MKKLRKNMLIVTSLLPVSSLSLTATLTSCDKQTLKEVHILNACDIHGEIPGYGDDYFNSSSSYAGAIRTVNEMQKIVEQYPGSICLSGGDNNSSGTFSSCTKGETMYPVLSAMDIRYSVVGNHAWEWGKQPLENYKYDYLGRTDKTEGNYFVTGNVLDGAQYRQKSWSYDENSLSFDQDYSIWKAHRVEWADPAKIIDMDGNKVCLIGLTTVGAMIDGNQEELKDTTIIPYIPAVHYAKHYIKETLPEEFDQIDAFVLYTHMGDGEGKTIVENIDTNIDLILGAHTHTDVSTTFHSDILNKDIPFLESEAHLASFADAKLVFDESKHAGSRLVNISTQTIHPEIDYGGLDPKDDPEGARLAAGRQIKQIEDTAKNQIVKNTIRAYHEQKDIAKGVLHTVLGHSNSGLQYEQLNRQFEHPSVYPSSGALIEQVGAWLCKANILGFNLLHKDEIEAGEMLPVSVGYCTNDSINVFLLPDQDFELRDIYGFYPYENSPVYGVLTYDQLEQLVRYTMSGTSAEPPQNYSENIRNVSTETGEPIEDLRTPYGQGQIYGMSFNVSKADAQDSQGRTYDYADADSDTPSMKVFDPINKPDINDIDDVANYKGSDYWGQNGEKNYIPIVLSNFNYDGGNKQQLMIKQFCEYNAKQNPNRPELQVHTYQGNDIRELMLTYLEEIKNTKISVDLSTNLLKSMFELPPQ